MACLLASVVTVGLGAEAQAQDHAGDKQALVALYNATDGPNWTNNENWLSDEPLDDWHGVTVSDGRVTELAFESNQLTGTIPAELGNLSSLTILILQFNRQLTGPIPAELGNLSSLEVLALGANQLTGTIPPELGNLSSLTWLTLFHNQLTGTIPQSFTNLTLERFEFNGNPGLCAQADAAIQTWLSGIGEVRGPDCSPSGMSSADREALVALYNATDGANWANNENWLSEEPLENWYGVTVSDGRVTRLVLEFNQLTGMIPAELGDLSSLTELDLSRNQLTGSIPTELGNLSSLTRLQLSGNRQWNFETRTYEGGLTGSIPRELGNLSSLTSLYLFGNQLTGSIPPELGNLSSLTELDLSRNQLTGSIPPELGNLSSLTELDLSRNQLTGSIPGVGQPLQPHEVAWVATDNGTLKREPMKGD